MENAEDLYQRSEAFMRKVKIREIAKLKDVIVLKTDDKLSKALEVWNARKSTNNQ